MKPWKMWLVLLASLVVTGCGLLLAGCGKQEEPLADGESAYEIYYMNAAMTQLVPREYRTVTAEVAQLVPELMGQILHAPAELDAQTVVSDRVTYQGHRQEDMVLYLYFDSNYGEMEAQREILCRAALVRTLTQIDGVDYIFIYAGDQPLTDGNGMPVGALSAADFVDSFSDVNAYERVELTLYFADETGEQLVPERREVVHNVNTSMERVIVEELISGPEQPGLAPTLEPGTKLLNVSVNENVCYLNFDSSFLNNSLEVREFIPIYSIVDSLSELSSVNRVQITVNGSPDVRFRDSIELNTIFERNLDYVGSGEQPEIVLPLETLGENP